MKKIVLMICATLVYVYSTFVFADSANELSQLLSPIHTLQSNFAQTVYDNHGKVVQRSYGKMSIQRPGKFRWDVSRPNAQLIVANGSRLWIYDPDLQQVSIRPLHQGAGSPALLLSQGTVDINDDYRVSKMNAKAAGWEWYSLNPRQSDNMFSNVQMGFLNKQLRQMRLRDQLGHQTAIQFINPRTNVSIAPGAFTFRAPRHVDVIDETRKQR